MEHSPHKPSHPSSPQFLFVQFGAHSHTSATHEKPAVQEHVPPQPSSPQIVPSQLGEQTVQSLGQLI